MRGTFRTDEPSTEIVRKALVDEFQRGGRRVVSGGGETADVPMVVTLRRFWASPSVGTLSEVAQLDAEILLGTVPDPVQFPVSGFFKTTFERRIIGTFRFDQAADLNGALADFVRNLTLDPHLRAAFEAGTSATR